jgi:hypothetical protein
VAALEISPGSFDFGGVTVSAASPPQTFTVTNVGSTAASVSLSLTGPQAMDFFLAAGTCAGMLAPATSCTVQVRFSPAATGARTASLVVSGGAATAALSGLGVAPWTSVDVGSVGVVGSSAEMAGAHTVRGSGADIWGAADAFRFVHRSVTGDVTISARVVSIQNTDPWAKAGVMIREGTGTGARNVAALLTPTAMNGYRQQARTATGGSSTSAGAGAGTGPVWLRIVRSGNNFMTSFSNDGMLWTPIGGVVTMALPATLQVGLAVTSHNNGVLATGQFDSVRITQP